MIKRKAPLSLLVTLDSISKNTLDFFSVSQSRQCLQIIGCDKVILRYLNSLLLILFVSIAATSCSDDNHKIIEQPSINVLSYYPKSMNIVELQYKWDKKQKKELTVLTRKMADKVELTSLKHSLKSFADVTIPRLGEQRRF